MPSQKTGMADLYNDMDKDAFTSGGCVFLPTLDAQCSALDLDLCTGTTVNTKEIREYFGNITALSKDAIEQFNTKYAKAWHGDQAIILNLDRPLNELGNKEIGMMSYEHFRKGTKDQVVAIGEKGKLADMSELWISDSRARSYRDIHFTPYALGQLDPCAEQNIYNMWTGWRYQPKIGDCRQYLFLMESILCRGSEIEFDYLLKWCASTIQRPDHKIGVAPAFVGAQGTGKGVFMSHLGAIHGKSFKHIINEGVSPHAILCTLCRFPVKSESRCNHALSLRYGILDQLLRSDCGEIQSPPQRCDLDLSG